MWPSAKSKNRRSWNFFGGRSKGASCLHQSFVPIHLPVVRVKRSFYGYADRCGWRGLRVIRLQHGQRQREEKGRRKNGQRFGIISSWKPQNVSSVSNLKWSWPTPAAPSQGFSMQAGSLQSKERTRHVVTSVSVLVPSRWRFPPLSV